MQAIDNRNVYEPLKLTPWQRQVLEALRRHKETEKYLLSEWYLGALHALDNPYNPDRVSQAAHSLRELLEKLPLVVEGIDVQRRKSGHVGSGFQKMRSDIEKHILTYKERYPSRDWKDQKIDEHLAKALKLVENYLELNKQPSRTEKMKQAVTSIDPMVNRLGSKIREGKRSQLHNLWKELERFAHHNSQPDEKEFRRCLVELERTIIDLLAPITAQDQKEIQTILNRPDRSETDVKRMFSLIERRGANFAFFLRRATETADATWLLLLNKKGYFADPPNAELNDNDWVIFPFWRPIDYLAKIADQMPDEVIEIVLNLPKVDNPRVYNEILEIALQLHGEQSAALKPKILESIDIDYQFLPHRYGDLLAHWAEENQTSAALELTKVLIEFGPNPQLEAKQKRQGKNPTSWGISLQPVPRIVPRAYSEIMSKGVRPLVEKDPYQVASLLIEATVNMIHLGTYREAPNKEDDASELWCERLRESDNKYEAPKATLVHTLTFACEQVYEKSPDSVVALDEVLRNQQGKVFKRLCQHLYTQYPNEQTKPWIRELILGHESYHLWEHHYEFQQLIRSACQYFGETLLTEAERAQIFDTILGGPSKADFQKWRKDKFTEEDFEQRQRDFHRKQLKSFEPVLFGEYATYFRELEDKTTNPISDEDYLLVKTKTMSGPVFNRSPHSPENLANLTDEELLTYINGWKEKECFYEGDSFVDINIKGLAEAFQTVFKEKIILHLPPVFSKGLCSLFLWAICVRKACDI